MVNVNGGDVVFQEISLTILIVLNSIVTVMIMGIIYRMIFEFKTMMTKPDTSVFCIGLSFVICTHLAIDCLLALIIFKLNDIMEQSYFHVIIDFDRLFDNIWFIFGQLYALQNSLLILTLFETRIKQVFHGSIMQLSSKSILIFYAIFVIVLMILPFTILNKFVYTIYDFHYDEGQSKSLYFWIIFVIIGYVIKIIFTVLLIALFIRKLITSFRGIDNETMIKIVSKLTVLTTISITITILCLVVLILSYLSPNNIVLEISSYFMFSIDIFFKLALIVLSLRSFHGAYNKICVCFVGICDHFVSYLIFGKKYGTDIRKQSAITPKYSFTLSETKSNKDRSTKTRKIFNVKRLESKLKKLNVSQIRKKLVLSHNYSIQRAIQNPRVSSVNSLNVKNLNVQNLHVTPEPSFKRHTTITTPTISNAMTINEMNGFSPSLSPLNSKLSASESQIMEHLNLDDGNITDCEEISYEV